MAFDTNVVEDKAITPVRTKPNKPSKSPRVDSLTGNAKISAIKAIAVNSNIITWPGNLDSVVRLALRRSNQFAAQRMVVTIAMVTNIGTN